ncbi:SDR family NAD(P)-dependent oxidoreductase [Amnibacterium flavum]|uniref:SDR family NAD(P)-dependent oxidoreductase n=1 Tax=Amnibacterium flavum TaxID=2173173 RepID=UPI00140245C3|nr:SDR family NAD(P)-dependent oxidoreductase [Amnibacterium flavum]
MAEVSGTGSRVVLTGGARGIGHAAALQLAARRIPLVLAVRDIERGLAARRSILQASPDASVDLLPLDLASLGSVREFAAIYADRFDPWSALVLNAGAILVPHREMTQDGFEMHLGVNHLGHFALTGLMLPLAAPNARVVTASSIAARMGRIQFHDLRWDHGYTPFRAYAASKRAGLVFARALHRKSLDERLGIRSIATHPGYAVSSERLRSARRLYERGFAHDYAAGAGPIVRAVTDPDLLGGEYLAPSGRFQTRGAPEPISVPSFADDALLSARLWRISGQLTRIAW